MATHENWRVNGSEEKGLWYENSIDGFFFTLIAHAHIHTPNCSADSKKLSFTRNVSDDRVRSEYGGY
jgi:hypothetical protein